MKCRCGHDDTACSSGWENVALRPVLAQENTGVLWMGVFGHDATPRPVRAESADYTVPVEVVG